MNGPTLTPQPTERETLTDCPDCEDGWVDVCTGYRIYGSGYGDCEQTWETRECETCGGSGLVETGRH